ncbi:hypothetical protein GQ53DRAFT_803005 [Thozetella sp. PMI_491]|nr:hypothetical protein GQ53DRAFT_803005 [Thozetella sp. PMI_491]
MQPPRQLESAGPISLGVEQPGRDMNPPSSHEHEAIGKTRTAVYLPTGSSLVTQPMASTSHSEDRQQQNAQQNAQQRHSFPLRAEGTALHRQQSRGLSRSPSLLEDTPASTPSPPETTSASRSSLGLSEDMVHAATQTYPFQPSHQPFQRRATPPYCESYTTGERIQRARMVEMQRTGTSRLGEGRRLPPLFLPVQSGHGTSTASRWFTEPMGCIEEGVELHSENYAEPHRKRSIAGRWAAGMKMWVLGVLWRVARLFRPHKPKSRWAASAPLYDRRRSGRLTAFWRVSILLLMANRVSQDRWHKVEEAEGSWRLGSIFAA